MESLVGRNLTQAGVARLRLDRAAAAFPEISELGFFARLVEELDAVSDDDWPGPDALRDLDPHEANERVTARLRARISAIMGYPNESAIDPNQPLTELGMDSLMAVRIRNTARGDFGVEPPVALLLQGASLQDLTADLIGQLGLSGQDTAEQRERTSRSSPAACRSAPTSRNAAKGRTTSVTGSTSNSLPPNAIAVVGMAGRFPGADSVSAFWHNLRRDEESIVTLSEDDLMAAGVGEKALANHAYVRRAALVDGIDEFDADFFGFTPQAARMMDPQHRLFLQCAWHALEDAGYDPAQIDGSIGVYGTSYDQRISAPQPHVAPRSERDHRARAPPSR